MTAVQTVAPMVAQMALSLVGRWAERMVALSAGSLVEHWAVVWADMMAQNSAAQMAACSVEKLAVPRAAC